MTPTAPSRFGWSAVAAVAVIAAGLVLGVQSLLAEAPTVTAPPAAAAAVVPFHPSAPRPVEPRPSAPGPREDTLGPQHATEFRRALESRFIGDSLDPEWSGLAETAVIAAAAEAALEPLGTPLDLRAQCTGHMCRIEIDFDNALSAADWASFYPTSLAPTLSSVHSIIESLPDGRSRVVFYGARTGFNQLLMPPGDVPPAAAAPSP